MLEPSEQDGPDTIASPDPLEGFRGCVIISNCFLKSDPAGIREFISGGTLNK